MMTLKKLRREVKAATILLREGNSGMGLTMVRRMGVGLPDAVVTTNGVLACPECLAEVVKAWSDGEAERYSIEVREDDTLSDPGPLLVYATHDGHGDSEGSGNLVAMCGHCVVNVDDWF